MNDMTITSAQYIVWHGTTKASIRATIDSVTMFVPLDPDNRHYQAILEWAKIEGNTIEEAD